MWTNLKVYGTTVEQYVLTQKQDYEEAKQREKLEKVIKNQYEKYLFHPSKNSLNNSFAAKSQAKRIAK